MFKRVLKVSAGGVALGLVGMGGIYQMRLKQNSSVSSDDFNAMQDQKLLRQHMEKAVSPLGGAEPLKMYRYSTCPFCGKVKAFLDYHKIAHECIEVEPIFKSEIQGNGYYKVPQLRFGSKSKGPFLVDSDVIVDRLSEVLPDKDKNNKEWKKQMLDPEVRKWREYARERLVRYLVININTSLLESWRGYSYIDEHDTIAPHNKIFLKVLGAPVMYFVSKYKTLPALAKGDGYDPSVVPPTEALRNVLKEWAQEGLRGKEYQGGQRPSVADIEVYGVLQSIRGHHVYDEIVRSIPTVKKWLNNMDTQTSTNTSRPANKN